MPVKVDPVGLPALVRKLERASKDTNKQLGRAVGGARRIAAAEATKAARGVYNVRRDRIAKNWSTSAPNLADLSFVLTGIRRPITIANYGFRQSGSGISAQVMQAGTRVRFSRGFMARGVPFQRLGKPRLPIAPLYGPSQADMLANPRVFDSLSRAYVNRMTKELFRLIENAYRRRG